MSMEKDIPGFKWDEEAELDENEWVLLQAADNKLRIDNMKEGLTASGDEIVDKWGKEWRNSEQNYDWDQKRLDKIKRNERLKGDEERYRTGHWDKKDPRYDHYWDADGNLWDNGTLIATFDEAQGIDDYKRTVQEVVPMWPEDYDGPKRIPTGMYGKHDPRSQDWYDEESNVW